VPPVLVLVKDGVLLVLLSTVTLDIEDKPLLQSSVSDHKFELKDGPYDEKEMGRLLVGMIMGQKVRVLGEGAKNAVGRSFSSFNAISECHRYSTRQCMRQVVRFKFVSRA
jgi:hypothetical protein